MSNIFKSICKELNPKNDAEIEKTFFAKLRGDDPLRFETPLFLRGRPLSNLELLGKEAEELINIAFRFLPKYIMRGGSIGSATAATIAYVCGGDVETIKLSAFLGAGTGTFVEYILSLNRAMKDTYTGYC